MPGFELVMLLLMGAIPLVLLARRVNVAYPIVLVLGGLAIGFVPGMPAFRLPPEIILVSFLPPLLYWEAVEAPSRAFRVFAQPILRLVLGLVVATDAAVAWVVHGLVPGMPWAVATTFGAIVAPTDEVAFTPVAERFAIPRRVVAIVEGESLLNDATSLVLYAVAIGVVQSGEFSWLHAGLALVWSCVAAAAIGLVAGLVVVAALGAIRDPMLDVLVSLLAGYLAYIPATHLGVSGVLAVVLQGLFVARFAPVSIPARARILNRGAWSVLIFVLNTTIFILLGLQLRPIVAALHDSWWFLAELIGAVNVLMIGLRFAWMMLISYPIDRYIRDYERVPPWRLYVLTSWAGFRGAVSLAAALAIPVQTASGAPFPHRDLLIFLTFSVILVTLVGQGSSLPLMLRALRIPPDESEEAEERRARERMLRTALLGLKTLSHEGRVDAEAVAHLERKYGDDARESIRDGSFRLVSDAEHTLLDLGHEELVRMRNAGEIENTVMRHLESTLDLRRLQLDELVEHSVEERESGTD